MGLGAAVRLLDGDLGGMSSTETPTPLVGVKLRTSDPPQTSGGGSLVYWAAVINTVGIGQGFDNDE